MTWDRILYSIATILSIVFLPIRYFWTKVMQRIDTIENRLDKAATKEEVNEKFIDVKEDLAEIKARLEKVIDRLLDK